MKSIDIDGPRKIMLDMLIEVDAFCKNNGITYYLDSGTLLGALRHKGYIPWDDDMDICMPRPDYDRFIKLVKESKIKGYIGVHTPDQGLFPYSKIVDTRTILIEYPDTLRSEVNIYIDLFPKDGLPLNRKKASWICTRAKIWSDLYWFNKYSIHVWKKQGNVAKRLMANICSPFFKDSNYPLTRCLRLANKTGYEKGGNVATIVAGGMHNCVPKSCFESGVPVEFEGHTFMAPIGYDQYLRTLYSHINNGDYMMLPKEEQKITHDTEMYWKDGFGE